MNKAIRLILLTIGILLLALGFGYIWDNSRVLVSRVLVYDLTAIFAGIGFIVMQGSCKNVKASRLVLLIIGVVLLVLGFGNILDDSRVMVYDLTAIFAGIGFAVISRKMTYRIEQSAL